MDGIYIPMKLPEIEDNHRIKAEIRKIDGELQFGIMTDGYYCCENWTHYPITTIQDHGDLIDIEPFMRGLYEEMCTGGEVYTTKQVYEMLDQELREMPTVIPAEEGE